MTTAIDTFIYLQRDIEQEFQRIKTIFSSSNYDRQELGQIFHHISCTLDDLEKVHQLINSSSSIECQSVNISSNKNSSILLNLSENDFDTDNLNDQISTKKSSTEQVPIIIYSNENENQLLQQNVNPTINNPQPSFHEREELIRRMKQQHDYYKNEIESLKKENQMEIIQLDQMPDEDHIVYQQDRELENMHHSIVSLKNLTQNINFEINDHIRVIDTLETGMIDNQSHVESLTNHTKYFIQTSGGGVGGHTCLFATAVGLFFLIVILIIFF